MKISSTLFMTLLLWASDALTIPVERDAPAGMLSDAVSKAPKGLIALTDDRSQGRSSRFFGGMPSYINPTAGFFPSPYNFGGQSPYFPSYGYMNGPMMNYGSFYPTNPSFYGNSFGGFSTTQQQQQQQQQVSQVGTSGTGIGGFQPGFAG